MTAARFTTGIRWRRGKPPPVALQSGFKAMVLDDDATLPEIVPFDRHATLIYPRNT